MASLLFFELTGYFVTRILSTSLFESYIIIYNAKKEWHWQYVFPSQNDTPFSEKADTCGFSRFSQCAENFMQDLLSAEKDRRISRKRRTGDV
jgi:hypothetical protein